MRRPLPFDYRGERPRASSSEAEAFELRLASVVDAERARLLAIGEGHQELGQLGVGAVRGDEARDIVAPVPTAALAIGCEEVCGGDPMRITLEACPAAPVG
jgi:hypothetical protein